MQNIKVQGRIEWPFFGLAFAIGFFTNAVLAVYAWTEGSFKVLAVGTLMALGFGAAGTVLGFLFALPRYSSKPIIKRSEDANADDDAAVHQAENLMSVQFSLLRPSNNLEQVADWLTKLLRCRTRPTGGNRSLAGQLC